MPSTSRSATSAIAAVAAGSAALLASRVLGQSYQTHNLTPDGYWHNRYHMLLSMAAYGNYNATCPVETFTQETELKNFPNATRPPWTVISTFGPTPSGAEGYTAIVPEMNKALIIFKGNYALEQTIPQDTILWSQTKNGTGNSSVLPSRCSTCTVNEFAWQGYMEAKQATNNFQAIREAYYGQSLVFSIAGHGLGGMHAQIAGVDLYEENIDYYNHAYGSPRVFNEAGAQWYADRFNGEAGERGVANNDQVTEIIPEGINYTHTGTPFYYTGFNRTSLGMDWTICWLEDSPDYSACMPRESGTGGSAIEDHYFYFTPVQDCGGQNHYNLSAIQSFLSTQNSTSGGFATSAAISSATSSTSSSAPANTGAAATTGAAGATNTNKPSSGSRTVVSSLAVLAAAALALPSLL